MTTILIMEDDIAIHSFVREALELHGFSIVSAYSGTEGKLLFEQLHVDLILLDLMLPGINGEEFLLNLRKKSTTPVIVISAKMDQASKLNLLMNGADDYITKPFDLKELIARIHIQLRHASQSLVNSISVISYKNLIINQDNREVRLNDQIIYLTGREYAILLLFIRNPHKVYSRANIYESVWKEPFFDSDKTINMHISNLRTKLSAIDDSYIKTIEVLALNLINERRGMQMWGWIFVLLTLVLLLYVIFLKKELSRLKGDIKEITKRAGYGSRLFVKFRDHSLLAFIDTINQMIDAFEEKNREGKVMEENLKLSITGLSHDLRTPLTAIHGYVQLLSGVKEGEKRASYLQSIEHAVVRLINLSDQYYDLARIEINQKELTLSSISFSVLIEETFLAYYEQLVNKQISVQFPEQVKPGPILGDHFMLSRVLENIVQNILRYAHKEVRLTYMEEGSFLHVTVKNDIKLHSKVAIKHIFTRFYTEDNSRTNSETSGLGLYMSKKLVEIMNGKMHAELKDHWFIIHIYLPLHR